MWGTSRAGRAGPQFGAHTQDVAGAALLEPMKRSAVRRVVPGSAAQSWFWAAGFDTQSPAAVVVASAMQNVGARPARSGHEP